MHPHSPTVLPQACMAALIKNQWIMEQDANEQQEVCAIHQLMKAPPHATKFARGRWVCNAKLRYQNYPCMIKKCSLSHPNDAKPIAHVPQATGFANTTMLRMSYRSLKGSRTLSIFYLTFLGFAPM